LIAKDNKNGLESLDSSLVELRP